MGAFLCVPKCSWLSCVFICVPVCPFAPFNHLFSVFSCVFLCFPMFSYGFPCVSCAFLDSFVFICFHCHCHCFICVKLFQKQSWECGFNSSWSKAPFEQYAYKMYLLLFGNPSLIEKHFFY